MHMSYSPRSIYIYIDALATSACLGSQQGDGHGDDSLVPLAASGDGGLAGRARRVGRRPVRRRQVQGAVARGLQASEKPEVLTTALQARKMW